jgi:hypothetical protein
MNLSKLKWVKNVKHKGSDKLWAYDKTSIWQFQRLEYFA